MSTKVAKITKVEEGYGNPLSILGEALESAVETFGEATTSARESAKLAATNVKVVVGYGTYKLAYGISYGLVFGGVFVKELLPESNSLRRGFEEGAEAAFDAAARRKVKSFQRPYAPSRQRESYLGKIKAENRIAVKVGLFIHSSVVRMRTGLPRPRRLGQRSSGWLDFR